VEARSNFIFYYFYTDHDVCVNFSTGVSLKFRTVSILPSLLIYKERCIQDMQVSLWSSSRLLPAIHYLSTSNCTLQPLSYVFSETLLRMPSENVEWRDVCLLCRIVGNGRCNVGEALQNTTSLLTDAEASQSVGSELETRYIHHSII
jgi:hypothetical protein